MGKLNRRHGIEVGSKVRVLNDLGSIDYTDKIGQVLTVAKIGLSYDYDSKYDLIICEGCDENG